MVHKWLNNALGSTSFFGVYFFQSFLEFGRKLLETSLATWLEVNVIKFGLLIHFRVAKSTCKVINTPGFVQGSEDVSRDNLIADKTKVSKQLMIVSFAIGLAFFLVMAMSQERLLTLRANKVLDMPVFAQCCHDTFFNWFVTGTANGNTHLVMTTKAVKFSLQFSCFGIKFYSTSIAVEMIRMIWFSLRSFSKIFHQ